MHRKPFKNPLTAIGFYLAALAFAFITLFPLLWVLKMSLISDAELFKVPPSFLPESVSMKTLTAAKCPVFAGTNIPFLETWQIPCPENFATVFAEPLFKAGLANTVVIAGITTLLCLIIGSLAAYALARIDFFAKKPVLSLILALSFFPAVAIIGPLFLQFTSLGILNTYYGVIIPDTLFALPLTVYLLVAYFRELPADLEEAAKRSTAEGDKDDSGVRWIRSYVLGEDSGDVGTVCIYEADSPEAIREHARAAVLPVDEIVPVADTVVVRPDPVLAQA